MHSSHRQCFSLGRIARRADELQGEVSRLDRANLSSLCQPKNWRRAKWIQVAKMEHCCEDSAKTTSIAFAFYAWVHYLLLKKLFELNIATRDERERELMLCINCLSKVDFHKSAEKETRNLRCRVQASYYFGIQRACIAHAIPFYSLIRPLNR